MKIYEYYVLECLCEFRVYIAICLVPNYGVNHYRCVGQTRVWVLQRRSNLSIKVYLCLAVHGICLLIDLESSGYDNEVSEEIFLGLFTRLGLP